MNFKASLISKDTKFVLSCYLLALICFFILSILHGPGIFAGLLLAIMTVSIGAGTLRFMHIIRDL